jgi:hypothetical protein
MTWLNVDLLDRVEVIKDIVFFTNLEGLVGIISALLVVLVKITIYRLEHDKRP